jgi:hypothetical protein
LGVVRPIDWPRISRRAEQAIADGRVSRHEAETAIGFAVLVREGGNRHPAGSNAAYYRRVTVLRDVLGLSPRELGLRPPQAQRA